MACLSAPTEDPNEMKMKNRRCQFLYAKWPVLNAKYEIELIVPQFYWLLIFSVRSRAVGAIAIVADISQPSLPFRFWRLACWEAPTRRNNLFAKVGQPFAQTHTHAQNTSHNYPVESPNPSIANGSSVYSSIIRHLDIDIRAQIETH